MTQRWVFIMVAGLSLILATRAHAGPGYVELDAGRLPASAEEVDGPSGPIVSISGAMPTSLKGSDYEDMYIIYIEDPEEFYASTSTSLGGSADFDTALWLFDEEGYGLLANLDTSLTDDGATLVAPATDMDGQDLSGGGLYLLAITGHSNFPLADSDEMFDIKDVDEVSSPDGSAGPRDIDDWDGTEKAESGSYEISLGGVAPISEYLKTRGGREWSAKNPGQAHFSDSRLGKLMNSFISTAEPSEEREARCLLARAIRKL